MFVSLQNLSPALENLTRLECVFMGFASAFITYWFLQYGVYVFEHLADVVFRLLNHLVTIIIDNYNARRNDSERE